MALSPTPNNFLVDLEKELKAELSTVSKLEEEFWAMKSRILWIVEGDKNTTFYHTSVIMHRRRNRISCLKDRMGNYLNGDSDIVNFIRTGFEELFSISHTNAICAALDLPFWH